MPRPALIFTANTKPFISSKQFRGSHLVATVQTSGTHRLSTAYRWFIVGAGASAFTYAALRMTVPNFDLRFLLLAAVTLVISSRFAVKIPRANTNVTVSDTFIFLTLLFYGGLAGIVLAAAEGLISGMRISKRPLVIAFNSSMM